MRHMTYLPGVSTLALDASLCNGCRTCTLVCPHGEAWMGTLAQQHHAGEPWPERPQEGAQSKAQRMVQFGCAVDHGHYGPKQRQVSPELLGHQVSSDIPECGLLAQ